MLEQLSRPRGHGNLFQILCNIQLGVHKIETMKTVLDVSPRGENVQYISICHRDLATKIY